MFVAIHTCSQVLYMFAKIPGYCHALKYYLEECPKIDVGKNDIKKFNVLTSNEI